MKLKHVLTVFLFIAITKLQAQEKFQISAYTGINQTLGEFKDFTESGSDIGLVLDYAFSKRFKLGFDANNQSNKFTNPFDFSRIPPSDIYATNSVENGNWSTTTIGFGPTYTFGKNSFFVDVYTKPGISFINSPSAATNFSFNGIEKQLFKLDQQSVSGFGITSGIRFNYALSDKFSVFLNPQHVYSSASLNYEYIDIDNAFSINDAGETFFDPGIVVEQSPIQDKINVSYLNFNVGVKYAFGSKTKKPDQSNIDEQNEETQDYNCFPAKLKAPSDQQDFYLTESERPSYQWEEQSDKKPNNYVFKLLNSKNQVVYSKSTKKRFLKHSKELEPVYKSQFTQEGTTFTWKIESNFTDCNNQVSKPQSFFGYKSSVGLLLDILEVECKEPAYDSNGNVHFTAKICVKNPATNTTNLVIPMQNFTVTDVSNTNSTNATQIPNPNTALPSPLLAMPINLIPGQQVCFYVEFSRPIGEQQTAFHLNYYEQGYPNLSTEEISVANLPSCICNICDEWQIVASNENFWKFNYNGGLSNMRLRADFKILNADAIQKVKAEIISVQHKVNDTLCYSCINDDNKMGLFHKANSSGKLVPTTGWQNSGTGTLFDNNNDNYGNQFTWSTTTAQGVDFSTNKMFLMNMSLPPISRLDCCETTYKVCIRYTFEDINCQSCDIVVCYDYDSSTPTSGGGIGTGVGTGVGTSLGSQSNQSSTILKTKN